MKNKGPYQIKSSKVMYKNPWIEVREEQTVRSNGEEGIYGIINYGESASTVAVNDKQEIFLVKEFFYALNQYGFIVPIGGMDAGETPLIAAKRELKEETGIVAKKWKNLGIIHPLTQILYCPHHLFLATDIEEKEKLEEDIQVVKVPLQEAYQMVLDGRLLHAPSCVAIIKAKAYFENE